MQIIPNGASTTNSEEAIMAKYRKPGFRIQRRAGWGMGLYRNRSEGWIAGVCAGLAEHWNVPNWMVRLPALALLFFTGSLAFWAYIVAIFVLASRRDAIHLEGDVEMEYDERMQTYRPRQALRYAHAPTERLHRAQTRLDAALGRVESMERYVTSRRYELDQKFSRL